MATSGKHIVVITRSQLYPEVARPGPAWRWTYDYTIDGGPLCQYGTGLTSLRRMLRDKFGARNVELIESWEQPPTASPRASAAARAAEAPNHQPPPARSEPAVINESAADLIYRFRTVMASTDADDAQADLAETVRTAAKHLYDTNPDRGADFSAGVDWAVEELRTLADDIANYSAGESS